jgi:hypothetical protein
VAQGVGSEFKQQQQQKDTKMWRIRLSWSLGLDGPKDK